jgi:formylglycine-generating enzyme required for sulfatase activity
MSELTPNESDLVLGNQNLTPADTVVLGGLAGKKQRLAQKLGPGINDELFDRLGSSEHLAYDFSQSHDLFEFETFTINNQGKIITSTKKHAFYYTENLGNNITLDMVYIPAGSFMIGSDENSSKQPIYQVMLKSFYMAKYPTTQAQYLTVMGNNPSHFQESDLHPVGNIKLCDAMTFCRLLSGSTGRKYSLPSENQWEYACRAGTTTPFYCGDTITTDFANYNGNERYADEPTGVYLNQTTPVGKYPPNSWGLYDMHGNVWEWCWNESVFESKYSDGKDRGSRILRGGSWCYSPQGCRSSEYIRPGFLYYAEGFRLCTY